MKKLTGMSRRAALGFDSVLKTTGATKNGCFNQILGIGKESKLPKGFPVGSIFKSPSSGAQITLVEGDRIREFDLEKFCKTTANYSFGMGAVDAGDDCAPGATILDGITTFTGGLSGFYRFDEETEQLIDQNDKIHNLFIGVGQDDGAGDYEYTPQKIIPVILGICLNEAEVGKIENWLFAPINITGVNSSGDNANVQSLELSYSLGEGLVTRYNVPRAA